MTACPAHLFGGPLACTLHAGHVPAAHVYITGSHVDDRHGVASHG